MEPHGPIGEWDVSQVTDMDAMFSDYSDADYFNQDLSKRNVKWNVRKVTRVQVIFFEAIAWRCPRGMWEKSPT